MRPRTRAEQFVHHLLRRRYTCEPVRAYSATLRSTRTETRENLFQIPLVHPAVLVMVDELKGFLELLDLRGLEQ